MENEAPKPEPEDKQARMMFVTTRLLELGSKANAKRTAVQTLTGEIQMLETEMGPLFIEHQQLMAALIGTPIPARPIASVSPARSPSQPRPPAEAETGLLDTPIGPVPSQVKQRIVSYLREQDEMEESMTATDIAAQLSLPVDWIRAVLVDMQQKTKQR